MRCMRCGSVRRILAALPECARPRYPFQGSGEPRASGSPSPPLVEWVGERRVVITLDSAARGKIPAGWRTKISGVRVENDDLLSLALSSKGGEGNGAAA